MCLYGSCVSANRRAPTSRVEGQCDDLAQLRCTNQHARATQFGGARHPGNRDLPKGERGILGFGTGNQSGLVGTRSFTQDRCLGAFGCPARLKPSGRTVVEEIQGREGAATAELSRRHSHHPACLRGVPRPHRSWPLQAPGQPLVHVREARQSDAAYPGPGQHRGNVEVRDRESLADQVTGCRQSLIVDSGFCN